MKKTIVIALLAMFSVTAWTQNSKTELAIIQTNGVCNQCKEKFEQNVPFYKGVTDFNYDETTSKISVAFDPKKTSADEIRQKISKLGYDADDVKADPKAREKLPACCKVDKNNAPSDEHKGCNHQHNEGSKTDCQSKNQTGEAKIGCNHQHQDNKKSDCPH